MNRFIRSMLLIVLCAALASCSNGETVSTHSTETDTENVNRYKCGTYFDEETGWCWEFIYKDLSQKILDIDPDARRFYFRATNLRYRYADDYWTIDYQSDTDENGQTVFKKYMIKQGIMLWGYSGDQKKDGDVINSVLISCKTPQEVLDAWPKDYPFLTLDGEMAFSLVSSTLNGPYVDELELKNAYSVNNYPKGAAHTLVEPDYVNGYKFQILYVCLAGLINTYIDVLYQMGPEYND